LDGAIIISDSFAPTVQGGGQQVIQHDRQEHQWQDRKTLYVEDIHSFDPVFAAN
jgi:hypothetical protein